MNYNVQCEPSLNSYHRFRLYVRSVLQAINYFHRGQKLGPIMFCLA